MLVCIYPQIYLYEIFHIQKSFFLKNLFSNPSTMSFLLLRLSPPGFQTLPISQISPFLGAAGPSGGNGVQEVISSV